MDQALNVLEEQGLGVSLDEPSVFVVQRMNGNVSYGVDQYGDRFMQKHVDTRVYVGATNTDVAYDIINNY